MGTGIGVGTFGEISDMTGLILTKGYGSLIPTDKAGFEALDKYQLGQEVKCKLCDGKISRSASQNSLLWGWYADMEKTPVNEYAGNCAEWWHKEMKHRYLCPIFIRDDINYAEMITVLHDIKDIDGYEQLRDGVINLTSTTKCSVEQFTEYLTKIERFCHDRGILLRTDPQILKIAMGIKQ